VVGKKAIVKPMMVSIILDETGSMMVRKTETICAFNEYIGSLKQFKYPVSVTLTKFNSTKVEVVYTDTDIQKVPELNNETYRPDELTPLYDAIGLTINTLYSGKQVDKNKSVLIVILTDGQENASKTYTQQEIFDLIKTKKEKGWTFVFMGADQDAWVASSKLGIVKGNTLSFSGKDIKGAMRRTAASTVLYASSSARAGGMSSSNFFRTTIINPKKTKLKR
jgi:hypothetical protein